MGLPRGTVGTPGRCSSPHRPDALVERGADVPGSTAQPLLQAGRCLRAAGREGKGLARQGTELQLQRHGQLKPSGVLRRSTQTFFSRPSQTWPRQVA